MIRLLLAAALAAPCVGCASVTRGTTENISISSTPSGATAEVSGLDVPTTCVTPCVVVAKRSADMTVTVNKEGYEPQIIPLTKEIPGTGAAGFAGNLLLGGRGRHGRRCGHRCGAGSQAKPCHRDPATGRSRIAASGEAAPAEAAAVTPELSSVAGRCRPEQDYIVDSASTAAIAASALDQYQELTVESPIAEARTPRGGGDRRQSRCVPAFVT